MINQIIFSNSNSPYFRRMTSDFSNNNSPSTSSSSPPATPSASRIPKNVTNADLVLNQKVFASKSLNLLKNITATRSLLQELRTINQTHWKLMYPTQSTPSFKRGASYSPLPEPSEFKTRLIRSSSSYENIPVFDEPMSIGSPSSTLFTEPNSLGILNIDLKFSGHTNQTLVESLEEQSVASLFEDKINYCLNYLDKLSARISDKSSKVLVTGDLNSGKSTFVNALIKRRVMPTDQQPCTMLFVETLNVKLNDGVEEAHAIPVAALYDRTDPSTFVVIPIEDLDRTVAEDYKEYELVKVYAHDPEDNESMLYNGILDIALIDSPGLNRDSIKTTQLFARQEEIDVVVFCVHAENQFTLSGQEFLQTAGREKAYIFIVVNRFDTIRDKNRCKRQILEQIKNLSPHTYQDADDLVHFVSADHCFPEDEDIPDALPSDDIPEDFGRLENSLRGFILEKRARSKLYPAKRFLLNTLTDVVSLTEFNYFKAEHKLKEVEEALKIILPKYEKTLESRTTSMVKADKIINTSADYVRNQSSNHLYSFIDTLEQSIKYPRWTSLFHYHQYISTLRQNIQKATFKQLQSCNAIAQETAIKAYDNIISLNEEEPTEVHSLELVTNPRDYVLDITISWYELFDIANKLQHIAAGISAISFVGTQVLGARQCIMFALNLVPTIESTAARVGILGFFVTGKHFYTIFYAIY